MAVLIEESSVVIRRLAIHRCFDGGWEGFTNMISNATLCFDESIARVGFASRAHADEFVRALTGKGLLFEPHSRFTEIVFADQFEGLDARCDWLEFARIQFGNGDGKISICWLYEGLREEPSSGDDIYMPSESMDLAVPEGWEYFGSLSEFTNALHTEGPKWL
jgi:hypothetical protein